MAVVILTVSAITNYKRDDQATCTEAPLIRTLANSAYNSNGFVKNIRLEQPNILGGVAAGSIFTFNQCLFLREFQFNALYRL